MMKSRTDIGDSYVMQGAAKTLEQLVQIKGRKLERAVVLFICIPIQNGDFSSKASLFKMKTSLKGKTSLPVLAKSFL